MDRVEKYLADYSILNESQRQFNLHPCSAKQYLILLGLLGGILVGLLLLVIFAGMNWGMFIYASLMSALVIFITPFIWYAIFKQFIKKLLTNQYHLFPNKQTNQTNQYHLFPNKPISLYFSNLV